MAFDYEYKNNTVLSKLKIGDAVYFLKDAEARAALAAEINKLGNAAYRSAADVVVEDSDNLVSGKAVAAYLKGTMAEVTKALIFRGISTTDPAEGIITINGEVYEDASMGDVIFYGAKEYVYDGVNWIELGDENIYLTKNDAAATYVKRTLTVAGINLEDDITVDELKAALGLKALAYKDSASGAVTVVTSVKDADYTPAGSVGTELGHTSTTMNAAGTFTPAGTVAGNVTAAGSVAIARDDVNGTAVSGTVSAPNVTVTPVTAQIQHIDNVGTLPKYTAAQYVAPSVAEAKAKFASEGVVAAVDGEDAEMLVFTAANKTDALTATGFNAGSYVGAEFDAGTLPTLGAAQTIVTGIEKAEASAPIFTGDKFGATFTGSNVAISADFTGTEGNVNVSGNYDKATSAASTFTGTAAVISHGVNTEAKTVTVQ